MQTKVLEGSLEVRGLEQIAGAACGSELRIREEEAESALLCKRQPRGSMHVRFAGGRRVQAALMPCVDR